jgi:hypothetical protein
MWYIVGKSVLIGISHHYIRSDTCFAAYIGKKLRIVAVYPFVAEQGFGYDVFFFFVEVLANILSMSYSIFHPIHTKIALTFSVLV